MGFLDEFMPTTVSDVVTGVKQEVQKAAQSQAPKGFLDDFMPTTPPIRPTTTPDYGVRSDNTPKETGFLGELKRPDKKESTELSIGVILNGKETEIPSLVPTLTPQEVNFLLQGNKPTQQIIQKAVDFAKNRISQGKSPFYQMGAENVVSPQVKKSYLGTDIQRGQPTGYQPQKQPPRPAYPELRVPEMKYTPSPLALQDITGDIPYNKLEFGTNIASAVTSLIPDAKVQALSRALMYGASGLRGLHIGRDYLTTSKELEDAYKRGDMNEQQYINLKDAFEKAMGEVTKWSAAYELSPYAIMTAPPLVKTIGNSPVAKSLINSAPVQDIFKVAKYIGNTVPAQWAKSALSGSVEFTKWVASAYTEPFKNLVGFSEPILERLNPESMLKALKGQVSDLPSDVAKTGGAVNPGTWKVVIPTDIQYNSLTDDLIDKILEVQGSYNLQTAKGMKGAVLDVEEFLKGALPGLKNAPDVTMKTGYAQGFMESVENLMTGIPNKELYMRNLLNTPFKAKTVTAYHISPKSGLITIDPTFMGTGKIGQEIDEFVDVGKKIMVPGKLQKSNWYVEGVPGSKLTSEGKLYGNGYSVYTTEIPMDKLANKNQMQTMTEEQLKKLGFKGWYSVDDGQVRFFEPVAANEVGKIKGLDKTNMNDFFTSNYRKFVEFKDNLQAQNFSMQTGKKIVNQTHAHGGATFNNLGESPKTGFAIGAYPDREVTLSKEKFNKESILKFTKENWDKLSNPKNTIGTWTDNVGDIHLDVSKVVDSLEEAKDMAIKGGQHSIWDFEKSEEIVIGGVRNLREAVKHDLIGITQRTASDYGYSGELKYQYPGTGMFRSIQSPMEVVKDTPVARLVDDADYCIAIDKAKRDSILSRVFDKRAEDSSLRIEQLLDGTLPANSGVTKEEKGIVDNVLRPMLKKAAEKLGIPEERYIENYFTHLFDKLKSYGQELPIELQNIMTKKIGTRFTMERTGAEGYKTANPKDILSTYFDSVYRSVHLNPVVKEIDAHLKYLPSTTSEYVKWFISSQVAGIPSTQNQLFANTIKNIPIVGQRLSEAMSKTSADNAATTFRGLIYANALGIRPKQFLINLTQNTNYIASTPQAGKYLIRGVFRLNTNEGRELVYRSGVMEESLSKMDISWGKKAAGKFMDTMMWNIRASEGVNRGAIYLAELERGLDNGLAAEVAKKAARDKALQIHFKYSHNIPSLLTNPLGRALGFFTTYPIKQTEFMLNMMKNKDFGGLVKYIATTYGMIKAFEEGGIDISRETGGGLFGEKFKYMPMGMLPTGIPFQTTGGKFAGLAAQSLQGDANAKAQLNLANPANWTNYPIMPGGRVSSDLSKAAELMTGEPIRGAKGKIQYQTTDPVNIALVGLGFRPMDRAEMDWLREQKVTIKNEKEMAIVDVTRDYMDGNYESASKKLKQYSDKGIIDAKSVATRIKTLEESPIQQLIKGLDKRQLLRLMIIMQQRGLING